MFSDVSFVGLSRLVILFGFVGIVIVCLIV